MTGFNGATLFQAWKHGSAALKAQAPASFNGATLFQAWKLPTSRAQVNLGDASMGPRSFKRGNPEQRRKLAAAIIRFNGATLFQAWKHRCDSLPFRRRKSFNGATLFQAWKQYAASLGFSVILFELQWGHALSSVETAAPMATPSGDTQASMGPRSFKRGNMSTSAPRTTAPTASMGPRSFKRGNLSELGVIGVQGYELQWGHALSSVETRVNGAMGRRVRQSFNGATLFQAWKRSSPIFWPIPVRRLQWGHALSSVETFWLGRDVPPQPMLQWGHALSSVETWSIRAKRCQSRRFNGATLFQAWKHGRAPKIVGQ